MPVTVKEVVGNAIRFLADFFPEQSGVRLEEVKPWGEGWVVTLSFPDPDITPFGAAVMGGRRIYKDVTVDKSGIPTEFTIRKV